MLNLGVLISGNGSNLQAILDACEKDDFPAKTTIVISNNPNAYGLERAKNANIPNCIIDHSNYTKRSEFENDIEDKLQEYSVDLLCLAGFMRILTPNFVQKWPNKIINTHPSLLPKFGGKGMHGQKVHEAVLKAGEKQSGCSIHFVIPEVDAGEVIVQKNVSVHENDTEKTLAERVLEQEHIAYPEAIAKIARNDF